MQFPQDKKSQFKGFNSIVLLCLQDAVLMGKNVCIARK